MLFPVQDMYDGISLSEVLDHVEEPEKMLIKIYQLLRKEGRAYITTVINAPAKDHIYLFHTIEEVVGLVKKSGFKIDDYYCATANNTSVEKAIKRKRGINIALILRK